MKSISVGTSGYNYRHWKKIFYPEDVPVKSWLEYYSQQFNTVEINATFYGHFKRNVYESWRERTPEDFLFTLKGPRFITHVKKLEDPEESLKYFLAEAVFLKEKLSVILWQFPPSFKLDEDNIKRFKNFVKILPKSINQVIEFRHKTWFDERAFEYMSKNGIGHVINDSSRFPSDTRSTGKIAYVRFHGPTLLYSSSYSDDELTNWAKRVKGMAKEREVFCYFNNDNFGFAIENAKKLIKSL